MVARTVKVKVQNRALCIERYKQHAVVCFTFFAACLTEAFNVLVLSGPRAIQFTVYRPAGVRKSIENRWEIDL